MDSICTGYRYDQPYIIAREQPHRCANVWEIIREDKVLPDPNEAYFAALDELTVESWHEAYRDLD